MERKNSQVEVAHLPAGQVDNVFFVLRSVQSEKDALFSVAAFLCGNLVLLIAGRSLCLLSKFTFVGLSMHYSSFNTNTYIPSHLQTPAVVVPSVARALHCD